jgi:hypothetical protein
VGDEQPQESLIADRRAGLTPADMVEQRLQALLGGSALKVDMPRLCLPRADGRTKRTIDYPPLGGPKEVASRRAANSGRGETSLYAVSIERSRAAEIFTWPRPFPCRFWQTDHRGLLLIHAWKRRTAKAASASAQDPLGNALVGVVELVDCITSGHAGADPDEIEYHWVLADPRVFVRPLPYAGRPGLFLVSGEVVAAAMRQVRTLRRPQG